MTTKALNNVGRIAEDIGSATNNIDEWSLGTLEDLAREAATQPRDKWTDTFLRATDDFDEAKAMIAAADKSLADINA